MCHVLIIEDEWLIADYLTYLVEQAGATSVVTAGTEDEAVQAAHDRVPDMILSDVKLPSGNGPHAVKTIITAMGAMPVIFVTGSPEECDPCEPPSVVMTKPVDPARVIETFKRLAPREINPSC